jgi:hypothetical protein
MTNAIYDATSLSWFGYIVGLALFFAMVILPVALMGLRSRNFFKWWNVGGPHHHQMAAASGILGSGASGSSWYG